MAKPFRWLLQWQILAAMVLVLAASSLLSIAMTDNLLLASFDRQLTARLSLAGSLAERQLALNRLSGYAAGDEASRVFAEDRRRLSDFARAQGLSRVTVLSADGRVRADTGRLAPGEFSGFELAGQASGLRRPTLLHRDARGRWQKVLYWPAGHAASLRLEAGPAMFRVLDRIQARRWFALGLGFLMALALSWGLSRLLGWRLSRLAAAFSALRSGLPRPRVKIPGQDEIAFLGRAFNDMAAELETRTERERREHDRRVAELKILAGGVAHEIRNPLGAIAGLSDLLARSESVKASANDADLARRLREEVDRLDRTVQDVMAYARQPRLQVQPYDVHQLLQEAAAADPDCEVHCENAAPAIWVDRSGMLTVLRNLLINAREAAGPGGGVCLGFREGRNRRLFYVADTGPGIPRETRPLVFQPFFSNKDRGSGLGLAIARNIVEAHGGRLRLGTRVRGALLVAALRRKSGGSPWDAS